MPTESTEVAQLRLHISQLENENEAIRQERDRYREKFAKLRNDFASLQSSNDALECELGDLKRRSARADTQFRAPSEASRNATIPPKQTPPASGSTHRRPVDRLGTSQRVPSDVVEIDSDGDESSPNPGPKESSASRSASNASQPVPSSSRVQAENLKEQKPTIAKDLDSKIISKRKIEQDGVVFVSIASKRIKVLHDADNPEHNKHNTSSTVIASKPDSNTPSTSRRVEQASTSASHAGVPKPKGKLPNIKIKMDQVLIPSDDKLSRFLKGATTFTIGPAPPSFLSSRLFICETYGGSPLAFMADSRDKTRHFVFPTPQRNPEMPTSPGEPGLLLSCRMEMLKNTCTVFARIQLVPAQWAYLGQYRSSLVGRLSGPEFKQQEDKAKAISLRINFISLIRVLGIKVKTAWADKILHTKKWRVYTAIRARMWLRKHHKETTDSNVAEELKRSKANQAGELSVEDVITSFERGDERINVIRMECVAYDHDFVQDMITKSNDWTPRSKPVGKASKQRKSNKAAERVYDSDDESEGNVPSEGGSSTKRPVRSTRGKRPQRLGLSYDEEDFLSGLSSADDY